MSSVDFGNAYPGWETTRLIGRGSYGVVYEIQRDHFGDREKAALKVISIPQNDSDIESLRDDGVDDESISTRYKGFLEEIVREYSLMAKIKGHPNTVYVDDVQYVQHEDGIGWDVYIKMELLTPLTKHLGKDTVFPDEEVLKIGSDMSNILSYCESKNIIHRDIKPQNIFVSEDGTYKLGDFGIAKTAERTTSGTKTGTYNYMAPEVYNNMPYGSKADIYSLGLTLYWLLNEKRGPFLPLPPAVSKVSDEEKARARRFRGDQIPAPAHGSEELKTLVLRACAFDPKERYQSASELREDLENIRVGKPLSPATQAFAERLNMEQEEESDGDATTGVLLKSKGSAEETVGVLHKIPEKGSENPGLPVSVTAMIVWEKDKEPKRPKAVSVVLMDGNNTLGSVELNAENGWSHTWQNLDSAGNYAVYQQEIPKGYKAATKDGRTNNAITIITTNTARKNLLVPLLIAAGALLLLGLGALMLLLGRMQIVRQPESVKVNSGTMAHFQVETKGRISQIKWQVSSDGGTTWRDIGDSNGALLQLVASPEQDGNLYRCILMQGSKSLASDTAKLEVVYIKIPDVLGKKTDEAKTILKEAGLVVTVNEEYNDVTPEGIVFGQEPDAGGNVDPGTSVSITVSLGKETFSLESVSLNYEKLTLGVGESAQLQAFIDPENASNQKVSWSSSDEKVATVSADGEVNALAAGTAVIEVKTKDGGKTATCEVTVTEVAPEWIAVTRVKLNQGKLSLTVGDNYILKADVYPEDATNKSVTWLSRNWNVAKVDQNGKITAVAPGTTTIIVMANSGKKIAACIVNVMAIEVHVTSVEITPSNLVLTVGEKKQLYGWIYPYNATNTFAVWFTSNVNIASVDEYGMVTAVAPGTATITIRTLDGAKTATCEVTVK